MKMDTEGNRIEIIMSHIRPFIITGTDSKTNKPYYNLVWERIEKWFNEEIEQLEKKVCYDVKCPNRQKRE